MAHIGGGCSWWTHFGSCPGGYNLATGNKWNDGLLGSVDTGAIGGALSATGLSRLAIFGANALVSAIDSWDKQRTSGNGVNFALVLSDGVIGGAFGALGGKGSGTKNLFTLGVSTVKRTANATVYKGIKSGVKEVIKAFAYYARSTNNIIMTYMH